MLRKFHPAVKKYPTLFSKTNSKYSIILHTQKFKLSFKVEFAKKLQQQQQQKSTGKTELNP